MASRSNRRKTTEPLIVVSNTAISASTAASDNAATADRVLYLVSLASITAGSITLGISTSPDDGTTWFPLATSEMNGNTGALTASGFYHVSCNVPFGLRTRLDYTIVTGPVTFIVYPIYERTGNVF